MYDFNNGNNEDVPCNNCGVLFSNHLKLEEENKTLRKVIKALEAEKEILIKCAVAWCEDSKGEAVSKALEKHLKESSS